MIAIFALLLQCAVFAFHVHNDLIARGAPVCAPAGAIDRPALAPDTCGGGKSTATDFCVVCQTLQHAGSALAAMPGLAFEFHFTRVDRTPPLPAAVIVAPRNYSRLARAPPYLV